VGDRGRRAQPILQQTLLGEASAGSDALMFVFTAEGDTVAVNDAAAAATGWSREELLELPADLIASNPDFAADGRRAVGARGTLFGSGGIRTKSGEIVPVTFIASRTKIGGIEFILVICAPAQGPLEWTSRSARRRRRAPVG